jgi:hypothetical protein
MTATAIEKYNIKGFLAPRSITSEAQNKYYTEVLYNLEHRGHLSAAEENCASPWITASIVRPFLGSSFRPSKSASQNSKLENKKTSNSGLLNKLLINRMDLQTQTSRTGPELPPDAEECQTRTGRTGVAARL